MCGIAGFFVGQRRERQQSTLHRMLDSLRHRGPDDEGSHLDPDIALGVRRLSVIDYLAGQKREHYVPRARWT